MKGKGGEKILNSSRVMAGMVVLLLSMAFLLFVITAPVIAQPVKVWVNAPEDAAEGGTFVATIDVDNLTNFNSGMFDLSFNSSVVTVTCVEDGRLDKETIQVILWASIEENRIRVLLEIPGVSVVSGSGYLAKICFHAVGEEGDESVLNLSDGELVKYVFEHDRATPEAISAEWIDTEVRIVEGEAASTANHVHNINTSENFSSIQGAINDPDTRDGNVIEVEDGVYYENVEITKSLTIRSRNGSANCIVQAAKGNDNVFEITVDHVCIRGFTVKGVFARGKAGINLNASHCCVSNNNCSNNYYGIRLEGSNSNHISNNGCLNNWDDGIYLEDANNNSISNNTCINNGDNGIRLIDSDNSSISHNNCSNNLAGIFLRVSKNNKLTTNIMLVNGMVIRGDSLSDYIQEIDESNRVNGKPVYYWKNRGGGGRIPDGAGQVIIVNCSTVRIENQNLSNASIGIQIAFSSSITIKKNNCSNNLDGISLRESNNNSIYLNNFINNANNADSSGLVNIWSSTQERTYTYNETTYTNYLGNYWDDYAENDTDEDGVGDIPYSIDSDKDNYPLMESWENYFKPPEEEWR